MKILHVYKTYYPESRGGIEETIRQLCISTGALGAENYIFTLGPGTSAEVFTLDNATVMRYPRNIEIASAGISILALKKFHSVASKMDIIHYHFPWPYADLLHLFGRIEKPAILTYHSDIVRQKKLGFFYKPLMRWFLDSMQCIVSTSPNYVKTSPVLKRYSNLEVIPLGIDQSGYPPCEPEIKQKLVEELGSDFFLFIGVMRYYKGLHTLLDAVKGTDLPVVIAGAGPIENEIKYKAKSHGLNNVIFPGRVSNQQRTALYEMCRAVVFPSNLRSEAFGLTLVEGAMYGKPLISTEIGTGTSYVNVNGETGIVVPPNDPQALRKALQILQNEPEKAIRMGENARLRYEKLFTAKQMGRAHYHLYNRVMMKQNSLQ